ncbi:hypothetical protein CPB84DRAFT_1762322 [Gymnopilus junonius]|uniref:Uncharacterized protein n=1 Tax=Gymnopilus junonius TaxID=109634 RepID=A0A9P5TSN3_GYMJU|nr:hypothetical protein CPB84DRAFT_1762322 [Gymnopilus junonius]
MFTRVTAFFVMALPILATAIALEAHNDCDTGAIQCCASVQTVCEPGRGPCRRRLAWSKH